MPNTKQARKRMRQDEERRVSNKARSSAMKTAVKRVLQAEDVETARAALPEAMKRIDLCAKKNILHQNAADRTKSRLHKHVAGL